MTDEQYLNKITKAPLSRAATNRWLRKYQNGNELEKEQALAVLVEHNLRLVLSIVNRYYTKILDASELFNIGSIGLMIAIDRFKFGKRTKLSTYATFWISEMIRRDVTNLDRQIRLPMHIIENMRSLKAIEQQLQIALGHDPTDAEFLEYLGDCKLKNKVFKTIYRQPISQGISSLDAKFRRGDGVEDGNWYTILPDRKATDPLNYLIKQETKTRLKNVLDTTLTWRQQEVMELAWGLNNGPSLSAKEISRELGIPVKQVNKLKTTSMQRLRQQATTGSLLEDLKTEYVNHP